MDFLINIVISIYNRISALLPTNLPGLPISTYTAFFESAKTNLIFALSGVEWFLPVDLILNLVLIILILEAGLFGFKTGIFLVNLARGSGA